MQTLRILLTPASSSSSSPTVLFPSRSSSELTEDLSIGSSELESTDIEESHDLAKPLPPIPPKEVPRPAIQRRTTGGTTATSTSIRSADDLLTQVGVLRDSANAARARRTGIRENRAAYDRNDDADLSSSTRSRARRRGPRSSCDAPVSSREIAQNEIDAHHSARRASRTEETLVDPGHLAGGPNDARRRQMRYLAAESSSANCAVRISEKHLGRKRSFLRGPASFIRRFLCIGEFSCMNQVHLMELHRSGPVDLAGSVTDSCARFDNLLLSEPLTTRRVYIPARASVVSSFVLDIR